MIKPIIQLNYSTFLGASVILSSVIAPTIAHAEPTLGQDGRSGESKTIYLSKPEVIQLDLSGTNGQAGHSYRSVIGSVVESAFNREHDRKKHHDYPKHSNHHKHPPIVHSKDSVTMADGEAGRNGGSGGNGGDGGSLTVYYNNLSDLKMIQVNSTPGRGAAGGSGERGSPGKKCSHQPPQHQPHHQNPPKKADEKLPPSCIDGKRGADGSNGASGRNGTIGGLTLIRGQQPIAGDSPRATLPLSMLLQAAPTLSLNRWDQKSGALGLLSQGSVIDNQYQEYRDRLEKTAKISWNATAPIAEYGNQTATLSLQNTGKLDLAFSDPQLWTIVQESEAPAKKQDEKPTTLLAINSIIHQREVTQLTPGITDKRDRAFTLNVIDTAGKSALLDTQFSVRVRSVGSNGRWGGFSNSTTEYEGVVPANLVTRDYNRFVLNLGALPVDADVFRAGAELEVEIIATRSLGTRSAQKTIDWSGTVY